MKPSSLSGYFAAEYAYRLYWAWSTVLATWIGYQLYLDMYLSRYRIRVEWAYLSSNPEALIKSQKPLPLGETSNSFGEVCSPRYSNWHIKIDFNAIDYANKALRNSSVPFKIYDTDIVIHEMSHGADLALGNYGKNHDLEEATAVGYERRLREQLGEPSGWGAFKFLDSYTRD